MKAYKYLYYQIYRVLEGIGINPNPKDNAIYLLLLFQLMNVLPIYFLVTELLNISNKVSNIIGVLVIFGVLSSLNSKLIQFEEVQNTYKGVGKRGFLILFLYVLVTVAFAASLKKLSN
jgi:hypothetical protein